MSKTFCCKSVDDNGDGLHVYSVEQLGSGGRPGMITDCTDYFCKQCDYLCIISMR